jgi:hypothetical protein
MQESLAVCAKQGKSFKPLLVIIFHVKARSSKCPAKDKYVYLEVNKPPFKGTVSQDF